MTKNEEEAALAGCRAFASCGATMEDVERWAIALQPAMEAIAPMLDAEIKRRHARTWRGKIERLWIFMRG